MPQTPSNVLFILSDEHTRDVTGCYGHPFIQTPNLDALAARGTRFDAAYTNCPICVPARASLHTGTHVAENHCWDNAHPYDGSMRSWAHRLCMWSTVKAIYWAWFARHCRPHAAALLIWLTAQVRVSQPMQPTTAVFEMEPLNGSRAMLKNRPSPGVYLFLSSNPIFLWSHRLSFTKNTRRKACPCRVYTKTRMSPPIRWLQRYANA